MTVINQSSISGITSITMPSGDGNVLTIHTNDGTERFRIDSSGNVKVGSACTISQDGDVFFTGVCTATTLTGAASGLTGALPAIDGSALTGMASTENVRTGILDVAGISTFRNTMNVGAAVTISESGIEASGIGITCASINGTQIGGRRNLIINGAMEIAQRATTYTGADNYNTVDRFKVIHSGLNEDVTSAQVDVSSGTTPYSLGFRKAWKITNGNQSGGAGAADLLSIQYRIEAQDLASSGWDYKSTSSYVTLSFWVKSSVAQSFGGFVRTHDGTQLTFPFETGSLSADTWTKITRTIPGHASMGFSNDTGTGIEINISQFWGTDYTTSSKTLDAWSAYDNAARLKDFPASTWYTTNDATFELTGVQLEVGSQATPFEHRRFDDELFACQRYYCELFKRESGESQYSFIGLQAYTTTNLYGTVGFFPRKMRALPTITVIGTLKFSNKSGGNIYEQNSGTMGNAVTRETVATHGIGFDTAHFIQGGFANGFTDTDGSDYIKADAEL